MLLSKSPDASMEVSGHTTLQCPLMDKLPPELRNIIWAQVLVEESTVTLRLGGHEPGLLRVSKQSREETLRMFYAEKKFKVVCCKEDFPKLARW